MFKILVSLFVIPIISLLCISQKEYEAKSFQEKFPSHHIINPLIMKPINKVIEKIKYKNSLLNVIILRIDSLNDNVQNIYIKASNFESEKIDFQVNNNSIKPKGYLWIYEILILLYNDTETFFCKINNPIDILKDDKKIKSLVEVHTSYYHYRYRKDTIYGNIEEFIELKGEMDKIEN